MFGEQIVGQTAVNLWKKEHVPTRTQIFVTLSVMNCGWYLKGSYHNYQTKSYNMNYYNCNQ